jgi:MFS family permease
VTTDRLARRAVLAGFAIQGLTFASIVTRLPTLKDEFSLSDFGILALLAAVAACSAVGSLLAGLAAGRWGSAHTLRLSLVGVSLGAILPAFAWSATSLVALTCGYGLFVGAVDASLNMQGVGVQARYGRSIMTGFHAMWSLGAAIGAAYAAVTLALDWSLLVSLVGAALAGLALNALLCGTLLTIDADPLEASATHDPLPWGPVLLIAVPTFAMWVGDSATSAWSGIYLADGLSASDAVAPIAFGAYQVMLFVVRIFGDRLVGRWGPVAVIRSSGWIATLGLLLVVAAPAIWTVVLGFALLGIGLSLVPPLSFVAAAARGAADPDRAVARVNVANYAGYLVAAFGIAVVAETVSHRAMFVVPLVLIVFIPLMARQFSPTPATPSPSPRM